MPWCCFKRCSRQSRLPDTESLEEDKACFFVITTIFNPASFQTRYNLYHKFAQQMIEAGAQLITIECIFPSLNQHEFRVTDSNNPYHIQLKSNSIYWMKENLINIAVSRLPSHAKWICWLDADIYFIEKNWIELTLQQLKKYVVVQMFEKAKFLGPQDEVLRTDYSFGYSVIHQKVIDQSRYDEWYPHPGYGWAMSKQVFDFINGLPDYDIVGSGDLHFAFSLLNRVSNTIEQDLHPDYKKFIILKSQEVFEKLCIVCKSESKSMVGYVPCTINHNWHGSRKDRQYVDRWKILIAHNFNYTTNVNRTSNGLLEFNHASPKESFFLQQDILSHFEMRNEDENEFDVEVDNDVVGVGKKKKKKKRNKKDDGIIYIVDPDSDCVGSGHNSSSHRPSVSEVTDSPASFHSSDDEPIHSDPDENPPVESEVDDFHSIREDYEHDGSIEYKSDYEVSLYEYEYYDAENYGNDYDGTIECTSQY